MSVGTLVRLGLVGFVIVGIVILACGMIGRNDDQNWQVLQYPNGAVTIIDKPGYYMQWFGTAWTWPRAIQAYYSAVDGEGDDDKDESIRVTFNDGGTATVSAMVRFASPVNVDLRRKAHREFSGEKNNMTHSVRSHLINCIKNTGPLMSASEHQSARKAEFSQIVEDQLRDGLYVMKKVERELKDRTDEKGKAITVFATEIVRDENGMPKIAQESPLKQYGIEILQFSITETQYDEQVLAQFSAKKQSFLEAEKAKAQREQEVQERLMVVERGYREKAQVEAEANKVKVKAVIEAQQKAEVALQIKLEAETKANQALEVARIEKTEAETRAQKDLEVAKFKAQAAEEEAKAIRTLANAEKERIAQAGAITEKERVLAALAKDRDVEVADKLANIKTPSVVIIGGKDGGGESSLQSNLINLWLMKQQGLIKTEEVAPAQP